MSNTKININSPIVQTKINSHQAIITRMATNSLHCKTWCISLVTAILAYGFTRDTWLVFFVSLLPLILFWALDSFYLGLERGHIYALNVFLKAIGTNEQIGFSPYKSTIDFKKLSCPKDSINSIIKDVEYKQIARKPKFKPFLSKAVAPFYVMQILTVLCIIIIAKK